MTARRIARTLPFPVVLAVSMAIAACGVAQDSTQVSEGEPVELGALEYNVLFSRFLNPDDVEDREYLVGQPPPPPDQVYLGVFVEIVNEDDESAQEIPADWTLTDFSEREYRPLPSESPYALPLGAEIGPDDEAPALDSTAQEGPTEGALVLFLLPEDVTEQRPIELFIPGEGGPATVELDV